MRQLAHLYPDLQILGCEILVIGGGSIQAAGQLAHTYSLPFPVLADPNQQTYQSYGLSKLGISPLQRSGTFLVDKAGNIRYQQKAWLPTGALDEEALQKAIKQLG